MTETPSVKAVADAFNAGENRYRQLVLGQSPLAGYPVVTERHGAADSLGGAPVPAVDPAERSEADSWSTPNTTLDVPDA